MNEHERPNWLRGCPKCNRNWYMKNAAVVVEGGDGCDNCKGFTEDLERGERVGAEMGWCSCGDPGLVDLMMLEWLEACNGDEFPRTVSYPDEARLLIAYMADALGWTEHGSFVTGAWIDKGRNGGDGAEALVNLRRSIRGDQDQRRRDRCEPSQLESSDRLAPGDDQGQPEADTVRQ